MIAREWEYLVPVRAYCELHDIPSQMGNEDIPGFWRLRETRAFVNWLRARDPRVIDNAALDVWLAARPTDRWHDLLRQAAEEHALETGGAEVPVANFIEWLAEWGREIRRRQSGLLLLSAHRAKGLEFDHVAVLDGGWNRIGRRGDPDEARRLYYVAMTRARQTLMLADMHGSNRLQTALAGNYSVVQRDPSVLPPNSEAIDYRHVRASLEDVDLSYAGRHGVDRRARRSIAALSPGDALELRVTEQGHRELLDRKGVVVGRLAKRFRPPEGYRFRAAEVFAIAERGREASDPQYRGSLKFDRWEVVVPEFVFEPDGRAEDANRRAGGFS